jgi:hypothetical protein
MWNLGLNGLEPEGGRTIEMHFSHGNPHGFRDCVHGKILLSTGAPQTRIVAIETREVEFGKAPDVRSVELR